MVRVWFVSEQWFVNQSHVPCCSVRVLALGDGIFVFHWKCVYVTGVCVESLNIHVLGIFFWRYLAIISGKLQANCYLPFFHNITRSSKLIKMLGHSII